MVNVTVHALCLRPLTLDEDNASEKVGAHFLDWLIVAKKARQILQQFSSVFGCPGIGSLVGRNSSA
jgi:hypothetical protein